MKHLIVVSKQFLYHWDSVPIRSVGTRENKRDDLWLD